MRAQASAAARPAGLLPALARAACCASSARPPPSAPPQCPLILGIWGGKGQGKTFQTEVGGEGAEAAGTCKRVPVGASGAAAAARWHAQRPRSCHLPAAARSGPPLPSPTAVLHKAASPGPPCSPQLCFKKLGVEPVIMSAGELEHEWAGTPGKLIRERYRCAGAGGAACGSAKGGARSWGGGGGRCACAVG